MAKRVLFILLLGASLLDVFIFFYIDYNDYCLFGEFYCVCDHALRGVSCGVRVVVVVRGSRFTFYTLLANRVTSRYNCTLFGLFFCGLVLN